MAIKNDLDKDRKLREEGMYPEQEQEQNQELIEKVKQDLAELKEDLRAKLKTVQEIHDQLNRDKQLKKDLTEEIKVDDELILDKNLVDSESTSDDHIETLQKEIDDLDKKRKDINKRILEEES